MSGVTITIIMFGAMFILLITGMPIAFAVGAVGMGAALLLWGPQALYITYFSATSLTSSFVLLALPLFIFMGAILQGSGTAEDLFDCVYKWLGGVRGGLAMGCVVICVIFAGMVGVSSAATVSLGLMAIPPMLKRGYNKKIITGTIQAGGALGILIPPSVAMVGYSFVSGAPLGRLFAGGILPGLMCAMFYIAYIFIRCRVNPDLGPAIPLAERPPLSAKLVSLRGVILPIFLIFTVLGTIFFGVCSPTEAAGIGVFGALVCAAVKRRISKDMLWGAMQTSFRIVGLIAWIIIAALAFSKVYTALGASRVIQEFIVGAGINRWAVLIFIQISFFILGMFLDDGAILFVCMPVYLPIIRALAYDPTWFAILYILNMQMAYLTPPFGFNLFYIRSVAPPEITLKDIYLSVIPFVCLQALALIIIIVFPQICLWLPDLMFGPYVYGI